MRGRNLYASVAAVILVIASLCAGSRVSAKANAIPLAGKWAFQLDPEDKGTREKWYNTTLPDTISLPGTTDQAGYGTPNTLKPELTKTILKHLIRRHSYIGPAWYQTTIRIPVEWKDKVIQLRLERVLWESTVWIDGQKVSSADSLISAHVHMLPSGLTPGEHRLTIRVDNSYKYDIGRIAHAYTEETQSIWNGIVGVISLSARDPIRIEDIQVYPDVQAKTCKVAVEITNPEQATDGTLTVTAKSTNSRTSHKPKPHVKRLYIPAGSKTVTVEYDMGAEALLWDEFSPALYDLTVRVKARSYVDSKTVRFGMRNFVADGTRLKINGRPLYLRGTLECCIFPRTGHPPMDKQGWRKVFTAAGAYGLNHLRFHSWCPPEAAFAVADEMGFYLQPENPLWNFNLGKDARRDEFIRKEALRIVKNYGNHPSFCMMSMGNELGGEYTWLHDLVKLLQAEDPRHLYTSTTFAFQGQHGRWPEPVDDFFISQATLKGWIRGQGFFNDRKPSTTFDFRKSLEGIEVPIISHEIGQYAVYPDLKEIKKYTGPLQPLNFLAIKQDLEKKGFIDQADDYFKASGQLSVLLYKEDIEMAMRTPGMSGFQLLDLHDFPGQGTALVGILDAFWESKGLIEPERFRRFCSPSVPLLRMDQRVFENTETFTAAAEILHYGEKDLANAKSRWTITDTAGRKIASGRFQQRNVPLGQLTDLGRITFDLGSLKKAQKLNVAVSLDGTDIINDWDFWVYPAKAPQTSQADLLIADTFNEQVAKALQAGQKVVVLAKSPVLSNKIDGRFVPVFWSPVHFPNQPGTIGLLCDPDHPAFRDFPTEFHTNWQWWELMTQSCSVDLTDADADFRPIVQMVDNFARNKKLANVFEARIGKGSLLFCSIDIETDLNKRPVARQLRGSLLSYAASSAFDPQQKLSLEYVKGLFRKPPSMYGARVIGVDTFNAGYEPDKAIDGDPKTMWHSQWSPNLAPYPHHIHIELPTAIKVTGFRYTPRQDGNPNGWIKRYKFYVSQDGENWTLADEGEFKRGTAQVSVVFADKATNVYKKDQPKEVRHIRFEGVEGFDEKPYCGIAELEVIAD